MSSNDPTSEREPVAPGQRIAAAQDLVLPSYDTWRGEGDLLRLPTSDADEPLRSFCREFAGHSAENREARRSALTTDSLYALFTFAHRSAVFAIRANDRQRWFDGLLAVAVVDIDRVDIREFLPALNVLDCTSMQSSITDAERTEAFKAAADFAVPKVADLLRRKAAEARPGEAELRERCLLWTVRTVYGVGLVNCGIFEFRPVIDLLGIAIEIGGLLESDRYLACNFTIAESFSAGWFGKGDVDECAAILARLHGVSLLVGLLRPEPDSSHVQMLDAWIIETANSADAAKLLRLSESPAERPKLGVARQNLFVLIVAMSNKVNIDLLETSDSLRRFEPEVARILESACRR